MFSFEHSVVGTNTTTLPIHPNHGDVGSMLNRVGLLRVRGYQRNNKNPPGINKFRDKSKRWQQLIEKYVLKFQNVWFYAKHA